ncbi:LPS-assembly protein LptD [Dokdonella soli]|uniref:LPS-assembly protein LptD n=1 Tax=Dokdonella soli TaxID=529810 RepID=UPI0031D5AF0C
MPSIPLTARRRRSLALAILLALPAAAHADDNDAPGCPVGVVKCPKKSVSWEMCRKNDLLDFYVPGLPTEGDRSSVPRDASAQKVSSPDKSHYVLEGEAQVKQLDLLLRADKITYDTETTDYTAGGHVRYQDRGLLLSADRARGNADLDQCTLDGVRYQLLSSRGNGVAQVAVMDDVGHARLKGATYSTCDVGDQQWAFRARDMDLDESEGVGRAHDMTFRIHNVPVFWLPYARFALDDRRVSGFLYPYIGYSNRRGFDFILPYYLNLAPNYDATLLPRLMTDRGFMLGGEFRYLTDSSKGTFNFEYIPNDRAAKDEEIKYGESLPGSRWWYRWQDSTGIAANWAAAVDINRVSDDRYFEDFGRGLYSAAVSFLPSSAYLYGHGDWWNASFGGDEYQITDPTLPSQFEPYRRLPRATFTAEKSFLGDLTGGVNSEFIAFSKNSFPQLDANGHSVRIRPLEGQRLDLFPYLAYPIETSAYFIRPQLGYRYTTYDLSHLDATLNPLVSRRSPSRGVPIFSLDTGLVFERGLTIGDKAWTQTLEPRAYYLRVPYRSQNDLPVFDTQEIPFSFGELFRSNRFVGADRQMDANNLSLALTTRFLEDATGEERLSASIGQIRYFGDQRVQLPGAPPTDYSGSTYAGEIDLHLSDRWRVVLDQQWNPNTHRTDLSAFTVQNRFGSDGIVNFSYRYRRNFLEQVDVSAAVPITPSWRLIARENYALNDPLASPLDRHGKDGRTLERFIGIEHDTCCIAWRVIARRWIHNVEGNADNAIYFEIEFKGVGSVGQKTDNFLRRGILGYQ